MVTCCNAADLSNVEPTYNQRLDLVLVRFGESGFGGQSSIELVGETSADRFLDPLVFPIGAGPDFGGHYLHAVRTLRERHPEVQAMVASGTALPFDDDSFDLVVLSQTLQQVRKPQLVLNEMLRVAPSSFRGSSQRSKTAFAAVFSSVPSCWLICVSVLPPSCWPTVSRIPMRHLHNESSRPSVARAWPAALLDVATS